VARYFPKLRAEGPGGGKGLDSDCQIGADLPINTKRAVGTKNLIGRICSPGWRELVGSPLRIPSLSPLFGKKVGLQETGGNQALAVEEGLYC